MVGKREYLVVWGFDVDFDVDVDGRGGGGN
jgi:hypothetical protein